MEREAWRKFGSDPMFFSIGSVIIDDIVLPDGQTRMGVLGGGATHAATGLRVWSDRVGVCAAVGRNFPSLQRGMP